MKKPFIEARKLELPTQRVSGARRSRRYSVKNAGGLGVPRASCFWTLKRRERRVPSLHCTSLNNVLAVLVLGFTLSTAHAQPGMGGPPAGPRFGGDMAKIFGENTAFSANLDLQTKGMTMPGKLAYLEGKSRFEMDMTKAEGSPMPPEQLKQMGLDKLIAISRPDKKMSYIIFPGMQSYFEQPVQDPDVTKPESDFEMKVTELDKETVDGHPCIKNKVVVTDKDGKARESTVWNATDLKKFPVKIETKESGEAVVMLFKDVKLAKPEATQFEPPAAFKKYDSMMAMMQQEMMKRMGGAGGPPGQP